MKFFLTAIIIVLTSGCVSNDSKDTLAAHERAVAMMSNVDVLLVSDHTLPTHLNLSSGGADGKERLFIDPTISSLNSKLTEQGLNTYILNVEDMVKDGIIDSKLVFDEAYSRYDDVLKAAVNADVTILAVHYDANFVPAHQLNAKSDYIGGAHVILDERATSEQTLALANLIINEANIISLLAQTGLRVRPGYDKKIRYQANLTLNIAGHSRGGAALLEIGAQTQATELFGSVENTIRAIDPALERLAKVLTDFRKPR
ncbi:hypothetical protein [Pseudoalteromonas pernae]|uniref:hypothetical protein n=1 Tax=Pseudoalteromonas pernae TaxID=3118054 RepID=UPI003242CC09